MAWIASVIVTNVQLIQVTCGHCGGENWMEVLDGDEGMTCCRCKKDSYFEPYFGASEGGPEKDEALTLGDGKESPAEAMGI